MKVVGRDKKKVLWGVVDDHVVKYPTGREDIVLRGFDYNFSTKMRRGLLDKGSVIFHIY